MYVGKIRQKTAPGLLRKCLHLTEKCFGVSELTELSYEDISIGRK